MSRPAWPAVSIGHHGADVISPEPVRAGAHVRVVSPSWPAMFYVPQRVRRAERVLRELGLQVGYGEHAFDITDDGLSAGSPEQRAADFMNAFTDPGVDAVMSAGGGATADELLPLLDARRLRRAAKPFVGNSDNVWLNHFLYQEAGLTSYYGVTFTAELGDAAGPFPQTLECLRRALMTADDLVCLPMPRRTNEFHNWQVPELEKLPRRLNLEGGWTWLRPGRGSGPLIGGELSALIRMVDHFDLKLDGSVLFWDIGLLNTDSARDLLGQLAERTSLDRLAGMLVGPDTRHAADAWAGVVDDAVSAVTPAAATYPIVVNADIGHLDPRWVVPYGGWTQLDPAHGVVFPRGSGGPAAHQAAGGAGGGPGR
jgi:muramoyltetrapeptide carboxypeptidase LdcA involved in peptidoglycan recycling